ncbi:MAG: efflux RND transporter periplasmic adaptor subunit [Elusimicrobiaceae bacterium]
MLNIRNRKALMLVLLLSAISACHKPAVAPPTPVKVKAFKAGGGSFRPGLYYSGAIEAGKSINLSFLTMGTVSQVPVREGDPVQKDQLLARLDCASNKNVLLIAQEKARQAQDAFNRFEPMYKHGNLAEIKMVDIRTAKTQAELAAKLAEKNVEDCTLLAPESGYVSERAIEPGDSVIPGKSALKLVTVDKLFAAIAVPEKEISGIKKGMAAEIEFTGQNNRRTAGRVADVGVSANLLARTYTVRILISNTGTEILPGMLCNVRIAGKGAETALVIPATAVKMDEAGSPYVYVIAAGNRARKRIVSSAGFREGGILISSGLRGGENIVSEGVQKLSDNALTEPEF